MYADDAYLALSGIQHFAFCRRQWALIHIEQAWQENTLTAMGNIVHERAHDETLRERRGDTIIVRGLAVWSHDLALSGKCDVVEFLKDPHGCALAGEDGLWLPRPVEYKRGKRKSSDADRLQLCAQAMCLEEMLVCDINEGCLFYHATKSRERVEFDDSLRDEVKRVASEMHDLYRRRYVPRVRTSKACRSCSLSELCLAEVSARSVSRYIDGCLEACDETSSQ